MLSCSCVDCTVNYSYLSTISALHAYVDHGFRCLCRRAAGDRRGACDMDTGACHPSHCQLATHILFNYCALAGTTGYKLFIEETGCNTRTTGSSR